MIVFFIGLQLLIIRRITNCSNYLNVVHLIFRVRVVMLDRYFNKFFLIYHSLLAVVEFINVKLYTVNEVELFVKFSMKDTFKNRLMNFWLSGASNYRQKFSAAKLLTP